MLQRKFKAQGVKSCWLLGAYDSAGGHELAALVRLGISENLAERLIILIVGNIIS